MWKYQKAIGFAVVAALLASVSLGTQVDASREQPPPPPAWINEDGTADLSKMPDRLPVGDETGKVVGWVKVSKVPSLPPGVDEAVDRIPVTNDAGDVVGYLVAADGLPGTPLRFSPVP